MRPGFKKIYFPVNRNSKGHPRLCRPLSLWSELESTGTVLMKRRQLRQLPFENRLLLLEVVSNTYEFGFGFDNTVSKTVLMLLETTLYVDVLEWLFSKT